MFNNRIVEPSQYRRLKISLCLLGFYGVLEASAVMYLQAYQEVYQCPFQAVFEEQSGWSCTYENNETEFNCRNYFANEIKTSMYNLSLINSTSTPPSLQIKCNRLNFDIINALAVGLATYNLVFLLFLITEKIFRFLVQRISLWFALFTFQFVIMSQVGGLFFYFNDYRKYRSGIIKYWVPVIVSLVPPQTTSRLGEEEMVNVVQRKGNRNCSRHSYDNL